MKLVNYGIFVFAGSYALLLISYGLVKISGNFIYVPVNGAVICEIL